jgi:hypothetical protein
LFGCALNSFHVEDVEALPFDPNEEEVEEEDHITKENVWSDTGMDMLLSEVTNINLTMPSSAPTAVPPNMAPNVASSQISSSTGINAPPDPFIFLSQN